MLTFVAHFYILLSAQFLCYSFYCVIFWTAIFYRKEKY